MCRGEPCYCHAYLQTLQLMFRLLDFMFTLFSRARRSKRTRARTTAGTDAGLCFTSDWGKYRCLRRGVYNIHYTGGAPYSHGPLYSIGMAAGRVRWAGQDGSQAITDSKGGQFGAECRYGSLTWDSASSIPTHYEWEGCGCSCGKAYSVVRGIRVHS